jgi:hypothetical protein
MRVQNYIVIYSHETFLQLDHPCFQADASGAEEDPEAWEAESFPAGSISQTWDVSWKT